MQRKISCRSHKKQRKSKHNKRRKKLIGFLHLITSVRRSFFLAITDDYIIFTNKYQPFFLKICEDFVILLLDKTPMQGIVCPGIGVIVFLFKLLSEKGLVNLLHFGVCLGNDVGAVAELIGYFVGHAVGILVFQHMLQTRP